MAMKGKMMILRRAQLLCVLLVLCCAANVFADNIFKDLYKKLKDKITGVITLDKALTLQESMLLAANSLSGTTREAVENADKANGTTVNLLPEALKAVKEADAKANDAKSAAETFKTSVANMKKKMAEIDAKVADFTKAKSDTKVLTEEAKKKANEIRGMTTEASEIWDKAMLEVAAQTSAAGAAVTATEEAKNKISAAATLLADKNDDAHKTANEEINKAKELIVKAATDATTLRSSAEQIETKVNGASKSYRKQIQTVKTMMNKALGIDGGSFIVPNMIVCLASFLFVAFSF